MTKKVTKEKKPQANDEFINKINARISKLEADAKQQYQKIEYGKRIVKEGQEGILQIIGALNELKELLPQEQAEGEPNDNQGSNDLEG